MLFLLCFQLLCIEVLPRASFSEFFLLTYLHLWSFVYSNSIIRLQLGLPKIFTSWKNLNCWRDNVFFLNWIWRTNMSQGTLENNWIHAKIKSNSCFRFKCWFQFRFVCKKSSSRYMPSSPWQVIFGGKSLTGQFNIENCWFNSNEAWMNAFNVSNFGSLVRNAFVRKTHINERNWNFFAIYTYERICCFWRNLHCWEKFYTAAGSDGSDKSHLSQGDQQNITCFQFYQSLLED